MFGEESLENDKAVNDFRQYWRAPSLASQLSKRQRKRLTEKFLELVEKNQGEYAKQMSRTMIERNKLLRLVTKDIWEKQPGY